MHAASSQKRRGRARRGFTLLEIMLVVGLLALLAAFAIPALVGRADKAKIDMAEAAIGPNGTISGAIKMFKVELGSYPEELKDLVEKPTGSDVADKWTTPYLEDAKGLIDPWGEDFQYEAEGSHNPDKFDLWSKGPDKKDGTDDDITNWEDDR